MSLQHPQEVLQYIRVHVREGLVALGPQYAAIARLPVVVPTTRCLLWEPK